MNKIILVAFCLIAATQAVNLKGVLQKALMEQLMEQQQQTQQQKRSDCSSEPSDEQIVHALSAWMKVFDTKFDFNCNNKVDESDHQVLFDKCCPEASAEIVCKDIDPAYNKPEHVFCNVWDTYKSS